MYSEDLMVSFLYPTGTPQTPYALQHGSVHEAGSSEHTFRHPSVVQCFKVSDSAQLLVRKVHVPKDTDHERKDVKLHTYSQKSLERTLADWYPLAPFTRR